MRGAVAAMGMGMVMVMGLCGGLAGVCRAAEEGAAEQELVYPPAFPLQWRARIRTEAELVEADSEYPVRVKEYGVLYDYPAGRARVDMLQGDEGQEKVYVRRYDEDKEYMVKRKPFEQCRRAYLGEVMPFPDMPQAQRLGTETRDNDQRLEHFVADDGPSRVHMLFDEATGQPVELFEEFREDDGSYTKVMSYYMLDFEPGASPAEAFDVPKPFQHDLCEQHVGGFPYMHLWHHYFRL